MRTIGSLLLLAGFAYAQGAGSVTIYASLDQDFSQEILRDFQASSGIQVDMVFDTEATKTVGLVNRIISEQESPRCDVFWNNEVGQTIRLKNRGLLAPYKSPMAEGIPAAYKDAEGYWTGLAARARVFIYNRDLLGDAALPRGLEDLTAAAWRGKVCMARPLTGTTLTQFAALFSIWGEERATRFVDDLLAADIAWQGGNAMVMRAVGQGDFVWGFTDTDDAHVSQLKGHPTDIVIPDQGEGGLGTLLIPNSVAMIKGARNPDNARRLIDYILSPEVEKRLAAGRSAQIPLREGLAPPPGLGDIKAMAVDWEKVGAEIEARADWFAEKFRTDVGEPGEKSRRALWIAIGCAILITLIAARRRGAAA